MAELFPALSEAEIKKRSEAERRLPSWISQPTQFPAVNLVDAAQDIDDFADFIDDDLRAHIKRSITINKLFPVQKCLIPVLTKQFRSRPYRRPNDICVSSPTGSGKTLAFVIPIINYLKQSLTRSLRALIVLPSRDLAHQVFKSFLQVSQPTHLRCALATGDAQDRGFFRRLPKYVDDGEDDSSGMRRYPILHNQHLDMQMPSENDFVSAIDILVSTPGVLIDLMHSSPGFTLQDLEILVMDEADRLMVNHHHDWLNAIESAVFPNMLQCPCIDIRHVDVDQDSASDKMTNNRSSFFAANGCALKNAYQSRPLHKLLFSATLSSDPQVLMHMNLFQPRLFLATKPSLTATKIRHSLGSQASTPAGSPIPSQVPTTVSTRSELLTTTAIPEQLEEKMFITETKDKLYVMWYLLHELKYKNVICFTNDKRKSHELFLFLNEIDGVRAVNFSSTVKPEIRQKYINEFKKGQIEVIVATDLMGRGMDIDGVEYVISYDMPLSGTWYAHRVGRTARAGNKGTAITLVDTKQLVQFKKIVQLAHKMPNSMRLSDVIEEMKAPAFSAKADKDDNYLKTYENYKDKLNNMRMKAMRHKNKQL